LSLGIVTSVRAEGPALTLAMVDYSSLSARRIQVSDHDALAIRSAPPVAETMVTLGETVESFVQKISLSTTVFLHRQIVPEANPLLLTLKHPIDTNRSKAWGSLTAGYGQIFLNKTYSIYPRNGSIWQEPGYGFLKLSFNF